MSISPLPRREPEASHPPDPQPQKPASTNRRRQERRLSKTLALLFAALVILALVGCASYASIAGSFPQPEPTATLGSISTPAQRSTADPTSALVHSATNTPTVTASPSLTSTPTSAPTATDPPTATPVATHTPTSTPSPAPTATSLPTATLPPAPTSTPQAGIAHVVVISVDGMRPDALDQANTPVMDELRARGAYCPDAQTVHISYTLPSHASMLTGMTPDKNGLNFPHPYIDWPGLNGPTLFSVAHDAGLETAMVVGKKKLDYLVLPNSVDELICADLHDPEVKDEAVEIIQAGMPDVLFIHFPDTDRVGHAFGWMSTNQLYAITFVDGLVGEILAALEGGGYLDNTLLIITADHGGHYFGHGDDSPLDRTVPWLAVGPGVPQDVTLASGINTYDTAATVLHALELPIPEVWDGRPVLEIFD